MSEHEKFHPSVSGSGLSGVELEGDEGIVEHFAPTEKDGHTRKNYEKGEVFIKHEKELALNRTGLAAMIHKLTTMLDVSDLQMAERKLEWLHDRGHEEANELNKEYEKRKQDVLEAGQRLEEAILRVKNFEEEKLRGMGPESEES